MAKDHQLSVVIARDEERPERYRWVLLRANVAEGRSLSTYGTRREAEAQGARALANQISAWRALRML